MKTGNVIATGVRKGAVKESARGREGEKALSSAPEAAEKGMAAAPADTPAPKFLTVLQVARRWGVSESTVRRLIEEGALTGIQLRHARRLSLASVVAHEARARF
ncbi:MAG: helix-turn-helix domain-containing protein [Nitrospinae bacterium]|nr:helix-turn-helix domain-containing protein [Nitrospinota bacterium]